MNTPTSSGVSAEAEADAIGWRYRGYFHGKPLPWQMTDQKWLANRQREDGEEVEPLYTRPPPRPSSDTIGGGELDVEKLACEFQNIMAQKLTVDEDGEILGVGPASFAMARLSALQAPQYTGVLTGDAITEAMQICVDLLLLAELIGDKRFGAIVTEGAVQQLERADAFLQRLIKAGQDGGVAVKALTAERDAAILANAELALISFEYQKKMIAAVAESGQLAADLETALSASPHVEEETLAAVAVKALEWHDKSLPLMGYHAECDDDGDWRYSVVRRGKDAPHTMKRYSVDCGEYPSLEAAKAAAQQDYETHIRSALVPLPRPAIEAVGEDWTEYAPKPAIEAGVRKALQLCVDMIVANDLEAALANTLETARAALSLQGGDKL